jgi:thymidine phosphorylase
MSGRALGHTGGTLDKLECVPGLSTALTPAHFSRQVAEIGVAIAAQTAEMVPADKKIYALRDATATVGAMALGVSSIMSKKLAIGAEAILLDVKVGSEAELDGARHFAKTMVAIGARYGKRTVALLTRMEEPIGRSVGDAVELVEAIEALGGKAPEDLACLCELVSGHMLALGGVVPDATEGARTARQALTDGRGLAKLRQLVEWQGGDVRSVDEPGMLLEGCVRAPVRAPESGYVTAIDAPRIGEALRHLKAEAGARKGICGTLLRKKRGHSVASGEELATVLSPKGLDDGLAQFGAEVKASFTITGQPAAVPDVLLEVVEG